MDEDQRVKERLDRDDKVWDGPRLNILLAVSLAIAIAVIYTIASVRSMDFTWNPLAHDPAHEIRPSGW